MNRILLSPDISEMGVERVGEGNDPEVDGPAPNVDVVVADRIPTVDVPVTNAAGKVIRIRKVVDKGSIFALRSPQLRQGAFLWTQRPGQNGEPGKVLIQDRTGALLARFNDATQAVKHLKACGIAAAKLINYPKPQKPTKGK